MSKLRACLSHLEWDPKHGLRLVLLPIATGFSSFYASPASAFGRTRDWVVSSTTGRVDGFM